MLQLLRDCYTLELYVITYTRIPTESSTRFHFCMVFTSVQSGIYFREGLWYCCFCISSVPRTKLLPMFLKKNEMRRTSAIDAKRNFSCWFWIFIELYMYAVFTVSSCLKYREKYLEDSTFSRYSKEISRWKSFEKRWHDNVVSYGDDRFFFLSNSIYR